jgi:hypothetical protein
MSENKFTKYLFYAIGEIVLVVIGILIALQVNNWNENRKMINKKNEILESLQEELNQNIGVMKFILEKNRIYLNTIDDFLNYSALGETHKSLDEIKKTLEYYPTKLTSPILDNFLESYSKITLSNSDLLNSLFNLKIQYQWIEKFECNSTPEFGVFGFIYHTHPASAELLQNFVMGNRVANH